MEAIAVAERVSRRVEADVTIDCSGLPCPEPIRKARRAIEVLRIGQVLKIIATDSGAPDDIREWAQRAGRQLIARGRHHHSYTFYIRRTG